MILWGDSFDFYDDPADKYERSSGVTMGAAGRAGSDGITLAAAAAHVGKLISDSATVIVALAVNPATIPSSGRSTLFSLFEGGAVQLRIQINSSGQIVATSGSGAGTVLGTGTPSIPAAEFSHLEAKITIADSGSVEVRKNTATGFETLLSLSAVDTQATAQAFADEVLVGYDDATGEEAISRTYDDLTVMDPNGSSHLDFLGDKHWEPALPNADGDVNDWTIGADPGPPPASRWEAIDDAVANDDVDFIDTSANGALQLFALPDLAVTEGNVEAVIVNHWARKTNAPEQSIRSVLRIETTDLESISTELSSLNYAYVRHFFPTAPGGGQWSVFDRNRTQAGIRLV